MDYCKKHGIASLIMGSGNSTLSKAAAATADNVIFCWRDKLDTKKEIKISKKHWLNEYLTENKVKEHIAPEILVLFVDRTQGKLGSEGKALYCFKIDDDNMLKLDKINDFQSRYKLMQNDILKNAEKKLETIDKMQGISE